jgi:hypothetical protein
VINFILIKYLGEEIKRNFAAQLIEAIESRLSKTIRKRLQRCNS